MTTYDLDRLWRERQTSEGQPPRVLIRVFVGPGELPGALAFYADLQGVAPDAAFPYPEAGLRLAMVGAFLLIEGSDSDLAPFRATTGTVLVDEVRPWHDRLVAAGAEIVVPLREVPTGAGFNARHPDGTVVEYVQHRPTDAELEAVRPPGPGVRDEA